MSCKIKLTVDPNLWATANIHSAILTLIECNLVPGKCFQYILKLHLESNKGIFAWRMCLMGATVSWAIRTCEYDMETCMLYEYMCATETILVWAKYKYFEVTLGSLQYGIHLKMLHLHHPAHFHNVHTGAQAKYTTSLRNQLKNSF